MSKARVRVVVQEERGDDWEDRSEILIEAFHDEPTAWANASRMVGGYFAAIDTEAADLQVTESR